jgi:AcrR family transcriptional regulator
MAYPAGHRDEVKGKIVQSARRLFNRHGFDNVSVDQIMAGTGLTRGGFYSYFEARAICMRRCWAASLPIPNGRAAGRALRWTWQSKDVGRRWCARICRGSTLKTWRIPARWWRCPAM